MPVVVVEIARTPDACWRAFTDATLFSQWMPNLQRAEVISTNADRSAARGPLRVPGVALLLAGLQLRSGSARSQLGAARRQARRGPRVCAHRAPRSWRAHDLPARAGQSAPHRRSGQGQRRHVRGRIRALDRIAAVVRRAAPPVLRGAAWCCVVLRGAAWCCVVLRGAAPGCAGLRRGGLADIWPSSAGAAWRTSGLRARGRLGGHLAFERGVGRASRCVGAQRRCDGDGPAGRRGGEPGGRAGVEKSFTNHLTGVQ